MGKDPEFSDDFGFIDILTSSTAAILGMRNKILLGTSLGFDPHWKKLVSGSEQSH